jgi:two-component system sensor histidine kinase KdpD
MLLTEQPRLLSEVAHELRAPLAALVNGSELLAEDYEQLDPARVRELVAVIHRGTVWLQGLVENLLCASTVESGRFQVQPRPTDVSEVVTEVQAVLAPMLHHKAQALRVASGAATPPALADRRRLVQVLVNLIANASKFSEAGQPIDVAIRSRRHAVRVTVADRGPGLPPGPAAQLFQPYYRGAPTTHAGKEGVGLGLAIVQWIVEQHGGRVGARQRRGGGAEFWFELPLALTERNGGPTGAHDTMCLGG